MTKVGYDPAKDFVPVALMLAAPNVLVVKAALPVKSVQELIAYGKARRLTNASQGIGASGHLIGEQFRQLTGVELTHVHYRGAALAVQDVVAGHVDLMFDVVSLTREQVLSGQLRALAMLSPQRNPVLPDVPTAAEVGLAGLEGGAWFGLMAPAGTPRPIVDWLNAQTRMAYEASEVSERLTKQGLRLPLGTPEDFAALIAADSKRWGDVIRRGGIKLERQLSVYPRSRGNKPSALPRAIACNSAAGKPRERRPLAVSSIATSGKSVPNMICDVGTILVIAAIDGL